jgi:hypothetical protein
MLKVLNALVLVALCASGLRAQSTTKPSNWNVMTASEQAVWICEHDGANCKTTGIQPLTLATLEAAKLEATKKTDGS